jgi:hypothetical protein
VSGPPIGRAACGRLLSLWTPHAIHLWRTKFPPFSPFPADRVEVDGVARVAGHAGHGVTRGQVVTTRGQVQRRSRSEVESGVLRLEPEVDGVDGRETVGERVGLGGIRRVFNVVSGGLWSPHPILERYS